MNNPSNPPPRTVVFDLGGVLIDWNPRYLYRKLIADEAAMEDFLGRICTQDWNERQDAGRPFAEGIALLQTLHPDKAPLIAAYFERWPEMLGGAIPGTVDLLGRLRDRGTPLYALTNWSAETFRHAREKFDFLNIFQGIVVSGEVGTLKPERDFFQILFDRHGIAPEEAVFIDDAPKNVAGARAAGMRAVHFTGPEALERELARMGLL